MDSIDERLRKAGKDWREAHVRPIPMADPLSGEPRTNRVRSAPRLTTAFPGLFAAVVILGAIALTARSLEPSAPRKTNDAAAIRAASSSVDSETVQAALPGEVYSLLFDPIRNRIWFAALNISGPDFLIGLDASSGAEVERAELPDVENNGFTSKIELGSDGSVLVSEPYALIKYEPGAGVVTTHDFAPDAEAPQSDTPGHLAGSWISSFARLDGQLVVGRNGVQHLTVLDSKLAELRRISLPDGLAGPSDMASEGTQLFMTSSYGSSDANVWVMDSDERVSMAGLEARDLDTAFGRTLAVGTEGLAVDLKTHDGALPGVTGSTGDLASAAPDGNVVAYLGASNRLIRISAGKIVGELALAKQKITVINPRGQPVDTFVKTSVAAIAADANGGCWYVDSTSRKLQRVAL